MLMHYPPNRDFLRLFSEHGVRTCAFGHLHQERASDRRGVRCVFGAGDALGRAGADAGGRLKRYWEGGVGMDEDKGMRCPKCGSPVEVLKLRAECLNRACDFYATMTWEEISRMSDEELISASDAKRKEIEENNRRLIRMMV